MVGDPGTVMVSDAYAFGVRGFDTATALQVMDRAYLDEYLQTQDTVPGRTADLNTASHVPLPQPYVINPSANVPKA